MFAPPNDAYFHRRETAIASRKALVAQLKTQPARPAQEPVNRAEERERALIGVRAERARAKVDRAAAAEVALANVAQKLADQQAAELESKRGARRDRKALTAAEAKIKRDERYAARRARAR
jgi:hypothetical protein